MKNEDDWEFHVAGGSKLRSEDRLATEEIVKIMRARVKSYFWRELKAEERVEALVRVGGTPQPLVPLLSQVIEGAIIDHLTEQQLHDLWLVCRNIKYKRSENENSIHG